jgi:6-phosphogluconolactonase
MSRVYVANSDSQDLSVFRLDEAGGLHDVATLVVQSPPQTGRSMVMATNPAWRVLYTAYLSGDHYAVATFALDTSSGLPERIGTAPLADTMAYLATDRSGRFLLGASYAGNRVTVNAIGTDGTVGALLDDRPTAPKAHCILTDRTNRHVLYTSLAADLVYCQPFADGGGAPLRLAPSTLAMPAHSGSRFLALAPDNRFVYVNGELDGSVAVLPFDAASGALQPAVQTVSALAEGFSGKPWAADLQLTPDGRTLYVSERTGSTIAALAVEAGGAALRLIGIVSAVRQPRALAIDPTGRFLVAAGQLSNSLAVYAIDPGSGALAPLGEYPVGRNPTWIEIV